MTNRNALERDVGQLEYEPPRRRKALSLLGSVVYAVRFPDGVVKFGWSSNLNHRLDSLAHYYGQDPELIGFRAGGYDAVLFDVEAVMTPAPRNPVS